MKRLLFIFSVLSVFLLASCGDSAIFTAPSEVDAGSDVNIKYPNPISSVDGDKCWIAIVEKGSPENEWGIWKYVDDNATSDVLVAPTEAGDYEIRFHDNYPTESNHLVLSQELTVK